MALQVFSYNRSCFCHSFCAKEIFRKNDASHVAKITGFEQLAHVLESGTSVSARGRQFGVPRQTVRLWLHRYQTTGTVSKHTPPQQWAPQSNDQAAGSLHHCRTPAEQISARNNHCWHHPQTEKNKFWLCPKPCTSKADALAEA